MRLRCLSCLDERGSEDKEVECWLFMQLEDVCAPIADLVAPLCPYTQTAELLFGPVG